MTNPLSGAQTPSNCSAQKPGAITSVGNNLESAADCGFTAAGDLQKTAPGFLTGGVRFNGGNTGTLALSGTSAAVDAIPATAAGCSGTDQRDVARPQGTACDIGAYELFQPVEGQQFTTVVGQISAGGSGPTIDWGDGTAASPGTLDSLQQVTGTHTYAEEGVYHATINWKDAKGSNQQTPFDVKVVDAPLTAKPMSITAIATVAFNGAVATFTDANPNGAVSDFSATIDWGDGTKSAGSIATNPSGGFVVNGTHTYATAGNLKTTITISDVGGAQAVAHGAARVLPPPPTVSSVSPSAGPTGGANTVTITGTNFTNATAVSFGSTAATSFTVNSDTQISAVVPSGTAGPVDVTVTTPSGPSATGTADHYTYVAAPTVTSVSPILRAHRRRHQRHDHRHQPHRRQRRQVRRHQRHQLHGQQRHPDHRHRARQDSRNRRHHRHHRRRHQRHSAVDRYTTCPRLPSPSVSPASGPAAGGTSVTITGTNFTGATAVKFGPQPGDQLHGRQRHSDHRHRARGRGPGRRHGHHARRYSVTGANDRYTYIGAPTVTDSPLSPVPLPAEPSSPLRARCSRTRP